MIKNTEQYRQPFWGEFVTEATDLDSYGYQAINNTAGSIGSFVGATVAGLTSATYDIDVTPNAGTLRQVAVALLITDTWSQIAAKIQTALRALTSSTETVAIVNGEIRFTSAVSGSASSMLVAAGTAGSGGGDLLAAIDALGAGYLPAVSTAVPGHEGYITFQIMQPSNAKKFSHEIYVKSSVGAHKTGFTSTYDVSTGYLTVQDTVSGTNLATGDIIIVTGVVYK